MDRVSDNWLVRTANDLAVRALRQLIELKWLARRAGRAPWRQGVAPESQRVRHGFVAYRPPGR